MPVKDRRNPVEPVAGLPHEDAFAGHVDGIDAELVERHFAQKRSENNRNGARNRNCGATVRWKIWQTARTRFRTVASPGRRWMKLADSNPFSYFLTFFSPFPTIRSPPYSTAASKCITDVWWHQIKRSPLLRPQTQQLMTEKSTRAHHRSMNNPESRKELEPRKILGVGGISGKAILP